MCAETAPRRDGEQAASQEAYKTPEKLRETTENAPSNENEPVLDGYEKGQEISLFQGYGESETRHNGEIKDISPEGLYTIESGGKEYNMTKEGLRQDELKNTLHDTAIEALTIAVDLNDIPTGEQMKMVDQVNMLIDELVLGNRTEIELQAEVNNVIMEMAQADSKDRFKPAWESIKESFRNREDALTNDLTDLDFEDGDISDLMEQMSYAVEGIAEFAINGDTEKYAATSAELAEITSDTVAQLQEESVDATPVNKLLLADALNKFKSPLSLGARGVGSVSQEVGAKLAETAADVNRSDRTVDQIQAEQQALMDVMKAEMAQITNLTKKLESKTVELDAMKDRAETQPTDELGEIMMSDEGEVMTDTRERPVEAELEIEAGPENDPRDNKVYKALVNVYKTIGAPNGKMSAERFNDILDIQLNHKSETIREVAEAFESDLAEGLIELQKQSTETAGIESIPELPDNYIEPLTEGEPPVKSLEEVTDGLDESELEELELDELEPDKDLLVAETLTEAEMNAGTTERINRIADFLSTEDGRLAILSDSTLAELNNLDPKTYTQMEDMAVNGGFFEKRRAGKFVKKYDDLMAKAESQMPTGDIEVHAPSDSVRNLSSAKAITPGGSLGSGGKRRRRGRRGGRKRKPTSKNQ